MKFPTSLILLALVAIALADCGCLKCGKNLRVVSAPDSPMMMIYRGNICHCPKPMPYRIEIPNPTCKSCPLRTYGYNVQTVRTVKPRDPVLYKHGFQVQVPQPKCQECKYIYGLVAKPDRMVLQAPEVCPPPARCAPGPVFEYLPAQEEYTCNGYIRRKRDLSSIKPNWRAILQPKTIKTNSSSRRYLQSLTRTALNNHNTSSNQRSNAIKKDFEVMSPEAFRQRFFRSEKPKGRIKQPTQTFSQQRSENHPLFDQKRKEIARVEEPGFVHAFEGFKGSTPSEEVSRFRQKRSLADNSLPFYQIFEQHGKNDKPLRSRNIGRILKKEEAQKPYLTPFDIDSMLPTQQIYYLINFPIRALERFRKLKDHVSPMVDSVPKVMSTSTNYLSHFGKRLKSGAYELLGSVMGSFKLPGKMLVDAIKHQNRHKRDAQEDTQEAIQEDTQKETQEEVTQSTPIEDTLDRSKRALLQLVQPEDIQKFLKEKLSFLDPVEDTTPSSEEDLLTPITPENINDEPEEPQLVLEKLSTKSILDNGLFKKRRPIRFKKSHKSHNDQYTVKEEINDLIEEAKQLASTNEKKPNDDTAEIPLQTVKDKIKKTLEYIQVLVQVDFTKNEAIFEELLRMENLKKMIVLEWRTILEKKKYNDINIKINLLNKMEELLSKKEDVVEAVAECLTEDMKNFNTKNLIKVLVRLQKLQCILGKSVEEFGETIKYGTPVDVTKEFRHLELLDHIDLATAKNHVDLCADLRKQRDSELEKEVDLLDNLKGLLECEICENKAGKINDVAKVLWEIKNAEKIQRETLIDMHEKIQYGMKIRRELKIIFDLEKHLDSCCLKQKTIFKEISIEKNNKLAALTSEAPAATTPKYNSLMKLKLSRKPLLDFFKKKKTSPKKD